jgi:hypothetical protein
VDHLLVVHGIGPAKDNCRFVLPVGRALFRFEKHAVEFDSGADGDEETCSFELGAQYFSELLS